MIAAFLLAGKVPDYAEIMVRSVKKHMDCPLVQLTDETTPVLDGCEAIRLPWDGKDPMVFRALHMSRLEGDVMCLDTDIIVQHDLSKVFLFPFAVALTRRERPIYTPTGFDITQMMPFNGGLIFSRSRAFWLDMLDFCERNKAVAGWYVDQLALPYVMQRHETLILSCDNFNVTPEMKEENVSTAFAVHYKGDRKDWMRARADEF